MGRSLYGGIVRYAEGQNDVDDAIDTQQTRTLINNALHYGDEDGQVLVFYPGHTYGGYSKSYTGTTPVLNIDFGPFPVRMQTLLTTYPIRVRMYGSTTGAGTCKVWVVVGRKTQGVAAIAAGDVNVLYGTPTGSDAWIDLYDAAGSASTLVRASGWDVVTGTSTFSTPDGIGGNSTEVSYVTISLSVWVQGVTGTGSFVLKQLYAAETYGV